jgi:hypothetical protein
LLNDFGFEGVDLILILFEGQSFVLNDRSSTLFSLLEVPRRFLRLVT